MQRNLGSILKELRELQRTRAELAQAKAASQAESRAGERDDAEWIDYKGKKLRKLGPP